MRREVAFSKTMYLWQKVCFRCCAWLCFGREPEALLFLKRKRCWMLWYIFQQGWIMSSMYLEAVIINQYLSGTSFLRYLTTVHCCLQGAGVQQTGLTSCESLHPDIAAVQYATRYYFYFIIAQIWSVSSRKFQDCFLKHLLILRAETLISRTHGTSPPSALPQVPAGLGGVTGCSGSLAPVPAGVDLYLCTHHPAENTGCTSLPSTSEGVNEHHRTHDHMEEI